MSGENLRRFLKVIGSLLNSPAGRQIAYRQGCAKETAKESIKRRHNPPGVVALISVVKTSAVHAQSPLTRDFAQFGGSHARLVPDRARPAVWASTNQANKAILQSTRLLAVCDAI